MFQDLFSGLGVLPSIYGSNARVVLAESDSVSDFRNNQSRNSQLRSRICRPASGSVWYDFYFWFSFREFRGPTKRVET